MVDDKPPRVRRRNAPGSDSVKHRRTRSGCYTCRARRVKCDEGRPVCERCQKGARECTYPDQPVSGRPAASAKSGNVAGNLSATTPASLEDEERDEQDEDYDEISPITEGVQAGEMMSSTRGTDAPNLVSRDPASMSQEIEIQMDSSHDQSQPPSLGGNQSRTPSTEESLGFASSRRQSHHVGKPGKQRTLASSDVKSHQSTRPEWTKFSPAVQFYLRYHETHLTRHHYLLKYESHSFLRTTFLDFAVGNEALLYSVVGFAAYHHTVTRPDGQIRDFLQYYNTSVTLLRAVLTKSKKHDMAALLTILQLATFEEYLGEWVNLIGHQKAAFQILTELFTPKTIMETELQRVVISWYTRFDVIAGLLSGSEMVLGREWFQSCHQYYVQCTKLDPNDLGWKIEEKQADIRLLALDMALLIAKRTKGSITLEDFMQEDALLSQRIAAWYNELDPRLRDPAYEVKLEGEREPWDAVNPFEPGLLLGGPLWSVNFLLLDWQSVDLMHRYQTALALQQPPASNELEAIAMRSCMMIEAMERWPKSPKGTMIESQASLAINSLFFPKDFNHTMWLRRKYAAVECQGYIYPPKLRDKMALLWGDPSVNHWWLPNDKGYPKIIRDIRAFVEDRTTPPKDSSSSDLREMKTLFSNLNLDSSSSPDTDRRSPLQREASDESGLSATASINYTPTMPTPQPEGFLDPFESPIAAEPWTYEEPDFQQQSDLYQRT